MYVLVVFGAFEQRERGMNDSNIERGRKRIAREAGAAQILVSLNTVALSPVLLYHTRTLSCAKGVPVSTTPAVHPVVVFIGRVPVVGS